MPVELFAAPPPRLLEVAHVAHRLSVSDDFVRRLIRDGKLQAIRMGRRWRIDPVALEAFIDRQRTAGYERRQFTPPAVFPQAVTR